MKIDNYKEFVVYSILTTILLVLLVNVYIYIDMKYTHIVFCFLGGIKLSEYLLQFVKTLKLK